MDDYQLADLFFTVHQSYTASLTVYLGVISGGLLAAYLVADKLDRVTTGLVLFLFSGLCIALTNETLQLTQDFASLGQTIGERAKQPGADLAWHGAANGDPYTQIPAMTAFIQTTVFLAVVVFFFRLRWSRLRKQGRGRPDLADM
ncbi:MAG: hypothetical protein AAGA22_04235 [Pseudomonadota bacterium]